MEIKILVTDSNDNVPVFDQEAYEFNVPEDVKPGTKIGKEE